MKHSELTSQIISICIKVHAILGPGLLESVYEEAVCYELDKAGIPYKRQQPISVKYESIHLDIGFRADIIVDDKVLVELKSTEGVTKIHAKTTLGYMRFANLEVGLLINFNVLLLKDGITRLIDDKSAYTMRKGAS